MRKDYFIASSKQGSGNLNAKSQHGSEQMPWHPETCKDLSVHLTIIFLCYLSIDWLLKHVISVNRARRSRCCLVHLQLKILPMASHASAVTFMHQHMQHDLEHNKDMWLNWLQQKQTKNIGGSIRQHLVQFGFAHASSIGEFKQLQLSFLSKWQGALGGKNMI